MKQEYNAKNKAMRFARLKNAIHPLLLKVLTFKTTGKLRVDGTFPDSGNYLIVANHCCIEDIPTLGEAVRKHFFLLVSDEDKPTIDGLFLSLNGVEWVHRMSKDSRRHAAAHAVEILKSGYNFAMYPESTWNLSPTALVMPMNYGCIKIALEAGVPIIPVVSSFFDTYRHTIIGEKFYPTEALEQSVSELRDMMSGYVYRQIQEHYRTTPQGIHIMQTQLESGTEYYETRRDIPEDYWDKYVQKLYDAYARARRDRDGVRNFESRFIFTPKTDAYQYFQIFNSSIDFVDGVPMVRRITSEPGGKSSGVRRTFFEYGCNEMALNAILMGNKERST